MTRVAHQYVALVFPRSADPTFVQAVKEAVEAVYKDCDVEGGVLGLEWPNALYGDLDDLTSAELLARLSH